MHTFDINFFVCGLQVCVSHVTERIDSIAGIVLRAVFEANRRDETKVKMEKSG